MPLCKGIMMNSDSVKVKQGETVQNHRSRKHTKKQDIAIVAWSARRNKTKSKVAENKWRGNKRKSKATENTWKWRSQRMRSGAAGAPSTYNPTNASEAWPATKEEQRAWFSGGGKRPSFGILPKPLLRDAFWVSILTKMGRKLVGTIWCILGSEDKRD